MSEQEVEAKDQVEVSLGKREITMDGAYVTPAVDIYETPKQLVLVMDLPGVEAGNLEIDLKRNVVSIRGKVSEQMDGKVLSQEYHVKDFFRSFGLTDSVDYAGVQAFLSDGVLQIVFPKARKIVSRKIPICCE
jgi:HSP20 family protein